MRLIDADAFKQQIAAAALQNGTVNAASRGSIMMKLIDAQPEVGDMPCKPIANKYYYFCPKCGSRRSIKQKHNYCHDCGQAFNWGNEDLEVKGN